jgi:hypothetical protein
MDSELGSLCASLLQLRDTFYSLLPSTGDPLGDDSTDFTSPRDVIPRCSVRVLLPEMKAQVFAGCVLAFSGLYPVEEPPERTLCWRLGAQYGAKLKESVDKEVTHLVAANEGTAKVHLASSLGGIRIVRPDW